MQFIFCAKKNVQSAQSIYFIQINLLINLQIMIKKFNLLLVIALLFAVNVDAQTPDRKWGFGIHGGIVQYNGEVGNDFYNFTRKLHGFGGIVIARNLNTHLDLELDLSVGESGVERDNQIGFDKNLFQARLNLKYNFFKPEARVRPFVFVGVGYLRFDFISNDDAINNWQLPDAGLGLNFRLNEYASIVLKETFVYSSADDIENRMEDMNDMYLFHSLGIVFNLGEPKDADGDGVYDKDDECPDAVGLVEFKGCPDTDGDGIEDRNDECPNTAGIAKFNGCADSDGDGIEDKKDECPNEAGLPEFNGCPDTDGDGVEDRKDECKDVKGLAEFNGCPDSDGDGVEDRKDECKDVKGLAKFNGCPDTDGDGIEDRKDKCPKVAGIASNKGCPEVKKEVKKVLEKALHGIQFRSAKAIIYRKSYPILNNVAEIMKMNPSYKLKIQGHTDSYGNDNSNMQLSKDRAQAVKDYLVKKGIAASRLSAVGFGETKPVASNKTSKGRALNRRVELIVQF